MSKKIIRIVHVFFTLSSSLYSSQIDNIDWDDPERNIFSGCLLTLNELTDDKIQSLENHIIDLTESTCPEIYNNALMHIMIIASNNNSRAQHFLENGFFDLLKSKKHLHENSSKEKEKFYKLIGCCTKYKNIYKMPKLYFALCKKYYNLIPHAEILYKETSHPHKNVFYGLSILRFAQTQIEVDFSLSILEPDMKEGSQIGDFVIQEISQILKEKSERI